MTQSYRFLPWVRRGLAASLPQGAPKTRGRAGFKISLTADLVEDRNVMLFGPGDIIGIDTRQIVRIDPRAGSVNAEPNYLAAIEFDAPDFPWLFTTAAAGADARLAPWIALVVFDDDVGLPQVTPDAPLPWVAVTGAATAQLPDLGEAWAWAHSQRITLTGDARDADGLAAAPDLNVSRLVCPRRLAPNRRYVACVVPTWEVGRMAGLGLLSDAEPQDDDAPLKPAWGGGAEVKLPVYFHFSFATGEAGDFEALARRLKAVKIHATGLPPETERLARVYLGEVDERPETRAALPVSAAESSIRVDAPLDALDSPAPVIADFPLSFAEAVDLAVSPRATPTLLPPVYGDRHARRSDIDPARMADKWLDELNLDPRTRIAARMGGDVVRAYQEDLMTIAWQQVGDVMAANAQLSRSLFLATVAERSLERHTAALSPERFLMVTSVLHGRARLGDRTLTARIAGTSLPDRAFDAALRRLASPVGRTAQIAAVARGGALGGAAGRVNTSAVLARGIAEALQRDDLAVDPGLVPRDGLESFEPARAFEALGWAEVALRDVADSRFATSTLTARAQATLSLTPRDDLADVGLLTEEHLRIADRVAASTGVTAAAVLNSAVAVMRAQPRAVQIGIRAAGRAGEAPLLSAIVEEADRSFSEITLAGVRTRLLTMGSGVVPGTVTADDLSATLRHLPVVAVDQVAFEMRVENSGGGLRQIAVAPVRGAGGAFRLRQRAGERGAQRADIDEQRGAFDVEFAGRRGAAPPVAQFLEVMPPLDRARPGRTAAAYAAISMTQAPVPVAPMFIRADIGGNLADLGLAVTLRQAIAPETMFRRRAAMLVEVPDWIDRAGHDVFDPISAAPVIDVSFADLLVKSAPDRLMPADISIPDEAIAALKTNPRFVAAFMVGANHEMNRELLWRTYPTDSRGTSLTRFWNWFDPAARDVEAIHRWPAAAPLVARLKSGSQSQVALVVRGRLLQRYPNTHLMLWKAAGPGKLAALPADPAQTATMLRPPAFRLPIPPDLTVAGFDINVPDFVADPGWYLVLQEPVTEARFGLDDNQDGAAARLKRPARNANDLDWGQIGVGPGAMLSAAGLGAADAGALAGLLLQRQVRFAIHSSELADNLFTV